MPSAPVELLQEGGCRGRVGAVVEREGDVIGSATAQQGGRDPDPERGDARERRPGVQGSGRADEPRRGEGGGEGRAQRRPSKDRRWRRDWLTRPAKRSSAAATAAGSR